MTVAEVLAYEDRFRYQLLDRMKQDCLYYLGYGGRHKKHLWAGNEAEQIATMREIHNSFPDDAKPEWLTLEEINQFAAEMNVE